MSVTHSLVYGNSSTKAVAVCSCCIVASFVPTGMTSQDAPWVAGAFLEGPQQRQAFPPVHHERLIWNQNH